MKLIMCPSCEDVFRLFFEERVCKCGKVRGKYLDDRYAEVSKDAISIALGNGAIFAAVVKLAKIGNKEDREYYQEHNPIKWAWVRPKRRTWQPSHSCHEGEVQMRLMRTIAAAAAAVLMSSAALAEDVLGVITENSVYVQQVVALPYLAKHGAPMKLVTAAQLPEPYKSMPAIVALDKAARDGVVQVIVTTPEGIMADAYKSSSAPLRLFAGNCDVLPHEVITTKGINTLNELKGKVFGVDSRTAGTGLLVIPILRGAGLEPDRDYTIKEVHAGVIGRWDELLAGTINGGLMTIPLGAMLQKQGLNNLGFVENYGAAKKYQFTATAATTTWLEKNPAKARAYIEALRDATRDIQRVEPHAIAASAKFLTTARIKVDEEIARAMLAQYSEMRAFSEDLSEPGLREAWKTLQATGKIPNDAKFDRDLFVHKVR